MKNLKKVLILAALSVSVLCTGCFADKQLAEENGKVIIDLPPGEKLVNLSSDRFYQYVIRRKRRVDEAKEEYLVDRVSYTDKDQRTGIILIREH